MSRVQLRRLQQAGGSAPTPPRDSSAAIQPKQKRNEKGSLGVGRGSKFVQGSTCDKDVCTHWIQSGMPFRAWWRDGCCPDLQRGVVLMEEESYLGPAALLTVLAGTSAACQGRQQSQETWSLHPGSAKRGGKTSQ